MTESRPPPIDPTKNVLDLVAAAVLRLDDRRADQALLFDEKIAGLRREADLRDRHAVEMREAESRRIDANREVDVAAVALALERATVQAGNAAAAQAAFARDTADRFGALEGALSEGRGRGSGADYLWKAILAVGAVILAAAAILLR